MKTKILLLLTVCAIITSCTSNKSVKQPPKISPNSQLSSDSSPTLSLAPALMYFKRIKQRYPNSPEELSQFLQSKEDAPHFSLKDFKKIEFGSTKNGLIKVDYELKPNGEIESSSGTLIMNPEANIMINLSRAIAYFKKVNQRDPNTSKELYDFLSRDENAPDFNPNDFDKLELSHSEKGSLIIDAKIKGNPSLYTMSGTSRGTVKQ